MADVHKNIIVSFQVDNSGLQGTVDLLEQTGQVSKQAADAMRANFSKAAQSTEQQSNNIETLKKELQDLYKVSSKDVELGIADALVDAGVSAQEFEDALKGVNQEQGKTQKQAQSSKQQLKAMKEEMIQLALAGKQDTDQFKKLSAEAGHLEDTIGDVGKTIKHVGSDTHVFDGLISAATGIAGAFSVAQGAAGLFGSENEELQQALLKVNSAMAILQGLQGIQNTLQKDSAASLLFLREAQTADVVATEAQTVAKEGNIIVTYAQVAAQKALQIAMALSNPITLAVVAVITAATLAYKLFTADAKKAAEAQDQFNLSAEETNKLADDILENDRKNRDQKSKDQKAAGVEEVKIRATAINETIRLLRNAQENENALREEGLKAAERLENQKGANQDAAQVERDKKTKAAFDQAVARTDSLNEELHNMEIDDFTALSAEKAAIAKQAAEDRGKIEEDALRAQLARLKRILIQTNNDENKIGDIINVRKAAADVILVEALINKLNIKIQAEKDLIDAKTEKDVKLREQLISGIRNRAAEETALVNAQADADIADLVNKYKIGQAKLDDVDKDRTEKLRQTDLKVLDGTIKTNAKITDSTKRQQDLRAAVRKADNQKRLQEVSKVAQQIAGQLNQAAQTVGAFFEQQAQAQLASIDRQKENVKALVDAGEITEKEAILRNRRLDQQAKKIQQEQAKRQKAIALFEAVVNGAAATIKAAAEGGLALALVVGALAAAEIALIASKPIPKFRAGKPKGGFEGIGMIGEAGPELHESRGRMMLATEPTITYLQRNDRVFSARETADIISAAPQMNRQYQIYTGHAPNGAGLEAIDYKRFGSEVGAHVHNTAVNLTEKGLFTLAKKNGDFYKYLNARRGL